MPKFKSQQFKKQNICENKRAEQTVATMIQESFSDAREERSYKVLKFCALEIQMLAKKIK